jgi:hypothetical protein
MTNLVSRAPGNYVKAEDAESPLEMTERFRHLVEGMLSEKDLGSVKDDRIQFAFRVVFADLLFGSRAAEQTETPIQALQAPPPNSARSTSFKSARRPLLSSLPLPKACFASIGLPSTTLVLLMEGHFSLDQI